jgi:hypothetical protein
MVEPRTLPLFDPKATPQSWSERMVDGEYAVLFANEQPQHLSSSTPVCVVFTSLREAENYARVQTALQPRMRCSIYDHNGMGRAPVAVIAGAQGAQKDFLSAKFRRWLGGILFVAGVILGIMEWRSDFKLTWAGTLGSRLGPAGAILLLTELGVVLTARHRRRKEQAHEKPQ